MKKNRRIPRTLLVAVLALLVTVTLAACETDQGETNVLDEDTAAVGQQMPPTQQDTMQQGGVAASELEGDPSEYMGQTVRVEGQVAEVFGQSSFTMEGNWIGGNLLVILPQDAAPGGMAFNQGDNVEVTGDVREYVASDIETEYGVDLGTDLQYEEQEPVVIAQNVNAGTMQPTE